VLCILPVGHIKQQALVRQRFRILVPQNNGSIVQPSHPALTVNDPVLMGKFVNTLPGKSGNLFTNLLQVIRMDNIGKTQSVREKFLGTEPELPDIVRHKLDRPSFIGIPAEGNRGTLVDNGLELQQFLAMCLFIAGITHSIILCMTTENIVTDRVPNIPELCCSAQ